MFFIMLFFCFKQNTVYEWRISYWSSDVCSSDLVLDAPAQRDFAVGGLEHIPRPDVEAGPARQLDRVRAVRLDGAGPDRPALQRQAGRHGHVPLDVEVDRTSVLSGKSVAGGVVLGGRRIIKKKKSI